MEKIITFPKPIFPRFPSLQVNLGQSKQPQITGRYSIRQNLRKLEKIKQSLLKKSPGNEFVKFFQIAIIIFACP